MYLVVNTSKKKIILSDIGVQLQAGQMLDLDLHRKNNIAPQYSKDLSMAKKAGIIREMRVDRQKANQHVQPPVVATVSSAPVSQQPAFDVQLVLKTIRQQVNNAVQKSKTENQSVGNKQVLDAIRQLATASGVKAQPQPQQINMDTAMAIHAKSIDRLKKNTSGSIQYAAQVVKPQNLKNNLDDLMDLD